MEVTLNIFNNGLKIIIIVQNVFIVNVSISRYDKYFKLFKNININNKLLCLTNIKIFIKLYV